MLSQNHLRDTKLGIMCKNSLKSISTSTSGWMLGLKDSAMSKMMTVRVWSLPEVLHCWVWPVSRMETFDTQVHQLAQSPKAYIEQQVFNVKPWPTLFVHEIWTSSKIVQSSLGYNLPMTGSGITRSDQFSANWHWSFRYLLMWPYSLLINLDHGLQVLILQIILIWWDLPLDT